MVGCMAKERKEAKFAAASVARRVVKSGVSQMQFASRRGVSATVGFVRPESMAYRAAMSGVADMKGGCSRGVGFGGGGGVSGCASGCGFVSWRMISAEVMSGVRRGGAEGCRGVTGRGVARRAVKALQCRAAEKVKAGVGILRWWACVVGCGLWRVEGYCGSTMPVMGRCGLRLMG